MATEELELNPKKYTSWLASALQLMDNVFSAI